MMIIGCDFHPRFQQIAFVDQESGEYGERRLHHPEEAVQFYRGLSGKPVRIGLEATGSYRWFRRLVLGLGHELLVGDPSGGWRTLTFYSLNQHPTEDVPSVECISLEGWDSVDLNGEIE